MDTGLTEGYVGMIALMRRGLKRELIKCSIRGSIVGMIALMRRGLKLLPRPGKSEGVVSEGRHR